MFAHRMILLVLLFAALMPDASAQTCRCFLCSDTYTISNEMVLHLNTPCAGSKKAVVSELEVESTDGSSFKVYTKLTAESNQYYTAGSVDSSVSCFQKGSGNVGGEGDDIYVIVKNTNMFSNADIKYDIRFACIGDDPTPPPTPQPTPRPTPPPGSDGSDSSGDSGNSGSFPSVSGGTQATIAPQTIRYFEYTGSATCLDFEFASDAPLYSMLQETSDFKVLQANSYIGSYYYLTGTQCKSCSSYGMKKSGLTPYKGYTWSLMNRDADGFFSSGDTAHVSYRFKACDSDLSGVSRSAPAATAMLAALLLLTFAGLALQ